MAARRHIANVFFADGSTNLTNDGTISAVGGTLVIAERLSSSLAGVNGTGVLNAVEGDMEIVIPDGTNFYNLTDTINVGGGHQLRLPPGMFI